MARLALLWILFCCFAIGESLATRLTSFSSQEDGYLYFQKIHKKKKHHKGKQRHPKKHKSRKHKPKKRKLKIYSAPEIEKLLRNDHSEKVCNRLNCSSNLEIAKSCLPTRASYRTEKKCFQAFCSYGCNEEDYKTNSAVRDFCNLTCSSKKYLRK